MRAVSAYGLSLPKGSATARYGAEACGAQTTGVRNGWQCDATLWWRDAEGFSEEPGDGYLGAGSCGGSVCVGPRVGWPYNLRDVDCSDGNVGPTRSAEVGISIVTGQPCSTPALGS